MDNLLIRRALQCPPSTRKESYNLELGLLPISVIIMARRVSYLQYIVKSDENRMFFQAQFDSPSQGDWTEQARIDLKSLNIVEHFECEWLIFMKIFLVQVHPTLQNVLFP